MTSDRNGSAGHTPEGHTPEAPAADELGQPGSPGAGLTTAAPHPADAQDREHTAEGGDHHEEEALGPIDWRAWAASALGIAIAALIGLALALPTLAR